MSISPSSGARGSKIAKFEIYNVLEWESTFTLGLNAFRIIFIWSTVLYTRFFFYSVHPKTDSSFPLQYIIIVQKWQSLKPPPPRYTAGGDKDINSLRFS